MSSVKIVDSNEKNLVQSALSWWGSMSSKKMVKTTDDYLLLKASKNFKMQNISQGDDT